MAKAKAASKFHQGEFYKLKIMQKVDELNAANVLTEVKRDQISVNYKGADLKFVRRDDRQTLHALLMLSENFASDQYQMMDVKGKVLVDVGAFFGETAILFALRGASRVYAFEPYPYSFEIAKENIELNGLGNKITLINKGCGLPGRVRVDEKHKNRMYSNLKNFRVGREIEVLSLKNIVEQYNIPIDSRLKLDCEGCENSLIMNANINTALRFKQIFMEYHYGYKHLSEKLMSMLFDVKYGAPTVFNNPAARKIMNMGLIFAEFVPDYKDILE
ncbi:MAG: FkbM family methyltransferase [Candidatus Micrarchaeota archaeon]|nr:FkbM family methyltransferase [Candidatus Micrarchaeota archaeon]